LGEIYGTVFFARRQRLCPAMETDSRSGSPQTLSSEYDCSPAISARRPEKAGSAKRRRKCAGRNFADNKAVDETNKKMMDSEGKANRLIHATSPYLLQHAYNPVDWYEWSEEALAKAAFENKPVLVSIGYS